MHKHLNNFGEVIAAGKLIHTSASPVHPLHPPWPSTVPLAPKLCAADSFADEMHWLSRLPLWRNTQSSNSLFPSHFGIHCYSEVNQSFTNPSMQQYL